MTDEVKIDNLSKKFEHTIFVLPFVENDLESIRSFDYIKILDRP